MQNRFNDLCQWLCYRIFGMPRLGIERKRLKDFFTAFRLGNKSLFSKLKSELENTTSCNLHFTCDFDHQCDDWTEDIDDNDDWDDSSTWIAIGCSALAVILVFGFLGFSGGFFG